MFSSLRARLLASYLVIILVTLLLATIAFVLVLRPYQQRLRLLQLRTNLSLSVPLIRRLWDAGSTPEEIIRILQEERPTQGVPTRILLLNRLGVVLADSEGTLVGQRLWAPVERPGRQGILPSGVVTTPDGDRFYFVAAITRSRTTRRPLIVAHVAPVNTWRGLLDLGPRVLYTGLVALALAVVLAVLIARSFARPLGMIAAAAEEVAKGNLDLQLEIRQPTEMRRLVESFNTMTREVKAARQAQRDFIANVSHDLKTPLTSIQGYAQALLDGTAGTPEAQHRAASIIYEEATRMHRLVEQLLELARLDAGQIKMARVAIDLRELLSACVDRQRLRLQEREITLDFNVPDPLSVVGDPDRLVQVFTNLLDNALTYTPRGGRIEVSGQLVQDEGRSWVTVSVTDNGPGIAAEDLPRLFERFYRVDKARRRGAGSGLGLAIVKELVEAHGGRVQVESVVGLGTRFTVWLPAEPGTEPPAGT